MRGWPVSPYLKAERLGGALSILFRERLGIGSLLIGILGPTRVECWVGCVAKAASSGYHSWSSGSIGED